MPMNPVSVQKKDSGRARHVRAIRLVCLREEVAQRFRLAETPLFEPRYNFQLAEVAVPRKLFARILGRIACLCPTCASG
jgi:hypothetical protein